jgi:hypothetical protein
VEPNPVELELVRDAIKARDVANGTKSKVDG